MSPTETFSEERFQIGTTPTCPSHINFNSSELWFLHLKFKIKKKKKVLPKGLVKMK